MSEEKNGYVCHSMCAKCSYGDPEFSQVVNLPLDHGIYKESGDTPLLNANDHIEEKNVFMFGRCHSPLNPHGKLLSLYNANLLGNMLGACNPAVGCGADLLYGLSLLVTGRDFIGTPCVHPITPFPWRETDENLLLGGAPSITTKSKLICVYGGVIEIDIQEEEAMDNGEESDSQGEQVTAEKKQEQLPEVAKAKMDAFVNESNKNIENIGTQTLSMSDEEIKELDIYKPLTAGNEDLRPTQIQVDID